jgi:serine/threonine protein kinase
MHCGQNNRHGARFCHSCGQPPTTPKQQVRQRYATGQLPNSWTLAGSQGDEYLVVKLIAKGGMGAVYKVVRTRDHTIWALKEMSESVIEVGDRVRTIEAFREEARMLEAMDHDNLPKVVDLFEHNHRQYMVMEFIDGDTATEVLAQCGGQIPEDEVVKCGMQLCIVLDYLHSHNPPIIYRDLKPDNIMFERRTGRVKLIDFGIARRFKSDKKSDTVHLGTDGYAAPEQYAKTDRQSNAQTDIYALGATLHHLITGEDPAQKPFQFSDIRLQTTVSPKVERAIMKAVKARPEQRHLSAAEMYQALTGQPLPEAMQTASRQAVQPAKPTPIVVSRPQPVSVPLSQPLGIIITGPDLHLDDIQRGERRKVQVPITVSNGPVDVYTDSAWLDVSPEFADKRTRKLEIVVHGSMLPMGREQHPVSYSPDDLLGYIWWLILRLVHAHAYYFVPAPEAQQGTVFVGDEAITVTAAAIPSQSAVYFGWVLSACVVTAEISAAGWIIWILLLGL